MENSIFSYAQSSFSGMSNTLFSFNFAGGGKADAQAPDQLRVPWRDLQDDIGDNPLPLLEWQTRCSRFSGRDEEMEKLRAWADSKPKVSVKFICGPGGVGKSRLAAEFADSLDTEGWNAGFMKLGLSAAYTAGKTGTLIVIDYPEERQDLLLGVLSSMANAGVKDRLRLLLLTRSSTTDWKGIITNAHARSLVNWTPVQLEKLPTSGDAAYDIFASAQEAASENKGTVPTAVAQAALQQWMAGKGKEKHSLPLFLVAAGVYHALHEDAEEVSYTGPNVMEALVEREQVRLSGMATGAGLSEDALALALTYATLCKGVPLEELESDDAEPLRKFLGLDNNTPWVDLLVKSGHVRDGELKNLEPDIVGADFAHATLGRNKRQAPLLVFVAAARDPIAAIGTFGRLIYDAQDTLGREKMHLHHWLEQALRATPERCVSLKPWTGSLRLPTTLCTCSVLISKYILTGQMSEATRAAWLNNISVDFAALGQPHKALDAIQESVTIYRRLAVQEPTSFESDLAQSLSNLSGYLSDLGHQREALDANQESVTILRRLAMQEPSEYELDFAKSLSNLSLRMSDFGKGREALDISKEASEIFRRVAAQVPVSLELELAQCLLNLSHCYSSADQHQEALDASLEASNSFRRLAAHEPARFEATLARSLNNLSNYQFILGQPCEALAAIEEAVTIRRRLAAQEPAAFEPELAMSLSNLSSRLCALSKYREALEASRESVDIYKRHAKDNFLGLGLGWAKSLRTFSRGLTALNRPEEASAAQAEAEDIERRLEEAQKAGGIPNP